MDRRHKGKTERKRYKEEIEFTKMNAMNQSDDSVFFTIDEAEWGDVPTSPLPSLNPRQHSISRNLSTLSENGSLSSYTNAGFQDYKRRESNIHSRFDGDNVFLFNSPSKRRFNIRKQLAAVWCTTCISRIWQYLCVSCSFKCSCRDQRGVHCMYRLKQNVMRKLKVLQGILCLITIIQSGLVFLPLANITADFDGQCLLNSNLYIHRISRNDTVALDLARSQFGNKNDCNFTTFINVVVAVTGLFFIWFFIHTSYVSGLEHTEVKLQLPVLLCYLILLVSVIVSSFKITVGFNLWCYNIVVNNPLQFQKQRLMCKDYETLKWSTDNRSHFYTFSLIAEVSTWLLVLTLILQLLVSALHLYQNFKIAYDEIEIPHMKLKEPSEYSDDEQPNWQYRDALTSLDCSVAPLATYVVEYKKHQVLAKVVLHRDQAANHLKKFDLKGTFVLDKEKFKRNVIGFDGFGAFRSKGMVDFPLKMEPKRRKRRNWTGSCQELHTGGEFEDQIKSYVVIHSHEWHGFDINNVGSQNENFGAGQNTDWHNDLGSKSHIVTSSHSFEWPASKNNYGSQIISQSHEWHGFENNFVSYHKKASTSLPGDWQTFDKNFENQKTDLFVWNDKCVNTDSRNKDPWEFEELDHQTSVDNNTPNRTSNVGTENFEYDCETNRFESSYIDQFDSEKR